AAADTNGTNDIFVRDRDTATTTRISVNSQGQGADITSFNPAISASGNVMAFDSFATNLVPKILTVAEMFSSLTVWLSSAALPRMIR
ncbi:hypothetical protein QT986_32300, partial [Microcoleus sp. herbarium14]